MNELTILYYCSLTIKNKYINETLSRNFASIIEENLQTATS